MLYCLSILLPSSFSCLGYYIFKYVRMIHLSHFLSLRGFHSRAYQLSVVLYLSARLSVCLSACLSFCSIVLGMPAILRQIADPFGFHGRKH